MADPEVVTDSKSSPQPPSYELPECTDDAVAAFGRTDSAYWASRWRRLRHALLFVLIGPVRFVAVVLILAVYALGLRLFALVHRCALEDLQMRGGLARRWFLFGQSLALVILRAFGVRVECEGDNSLTAASGEKARFVVANHVSMLDILALYGKGAPDAIPAFVSKAGVLGAPIVGVLLRACRGIAVHRVGSGRPSTKQQLIERAAAPEEPPVAIFPEGTTSNGSCVCHFHVGAFVAGAPVKPVCLRYVSTGFNPAYDVIEAPGWLYGMLGSPSFKLVITYLPVYVPDEEERKDPELYAAHVRDRIAKVLGLPVRDVTFKHKLAYMAKFMGYKLKEHED